MISMPGVPKWMNRLVDWGSDRLNPLLVRSIRQNLRNRTFLAVFFFMLGLGGISCIVTASSPGAGRANAQTGMGLFIALTWMWAAGVIIVQSLSAYRSVITERQDDTWDLVELSTLEPRHIIRGLLYTSLVQGIMFSAAMAPFMVMAYMLRGLDVWVIALTFIFVPAVSLSTCTFSVFCACLAQKKSSQALLGLVALAATLWGYFFICIVVTEEMNWLIRDLVRWRNEMIAVGITFFNIWLMGNAMLLVFSAALLKHRAANRSTGPRSIWILAYLNLIVGCLIMGRIFLRSGNFNYEFLVIAAATGTFATTVLGLFTMTEHYRLTPRQDRDIHHKNQLVRWLMIIVGPGAARGRIAYIVLSFITLALAGTALSMTPEHSQYRYREAHSVFTFCWTSLVYFSLIFILTDYLYRHQLRRFFDTPALRRAFTLTFFAVFNILLSIIIYILQENRIGTYVLEILTPIYGMVTISEDPGRHVIAQSVLLIAGLVTYIYLAYQAVGHYHYQRLRVVAGDGNHNPRGN